ncbi:hypothetical protein CQA62_00235 [Helicobacter cholecystus]|uniref:Uncharacterized protein n=1 Tax=Helicobacter cholecystus TaxID=45498 RepID=A0A3D8IX84_9HELI|nr:hydrogenase small subunit [Helicobacter cholecystus]RDU69877.1 hypothetical protein CQA62_00235 [Helicobacter cholecystus]VEJ25742.1 putative Ni/Fe-hydrogenase small subunit [Helicobacter cholecystus]
MEFVQKLNKRLENLSPYFLRDFSNQEKEWVKNAITLLGLPKEHLDTYYEILTHSNYRVIWLHMEECSGCSESLLMNSDFGFERFVIDFMQIQYHDMLMANSGYQTKQTLKESITNHPYILIVEGSISEEGDMYLTLGAEAHSGAKECRELAQGAEFVIAVGSCSSFGGIQVAHPNPSKAKPLNEIIQRQTINIAGCPPSDTNICATLLYLALMGESPKLDDYSRPIWSHGKTVHDLCERKGAFGAGEFVQEFGDEGSKLGYCLYKVGCRGPYVYNNCGKVKFNSKLSWPIQAGHGCIGCSEPNFWDNMGKFEEPMGNNIPKLAPSDKYNPKLAKFFTAQSFQNESALPEFCDQKRINHALLISLWFDKPSKFISYKEGKCQEVDALAFECNPKILFETLKTKTKIGGKLADNYLKAFPTKEAFINSLSADSKISSNLTDLFGAICMLIGEDRQYANKELPQLAEQFIHSYASKYAMKFKADAEGKYNVDFSKFINPLFSYAVGGLDIYGLCYGVIDSYAESFGDIANGFENIILCGDVFAQKEKSLFVRKLLEYGRGKTFYLA